MKDKIVLVRDSDGAMWVEHTYVTTDIHPIEDLGAWGQEYAKQVFAGCAGCRDEETHYRVRFLISGGPGVQLGLMCRAIKD